MCFCSKCAGGVGKCDGQGGRVCFILSAEGRLCVCVEVSKRFALCLKKRGGLLVDLNYRRWI